METRDELKSEFAKWTKILVEAKEKQKQLMDYKCTTEVLAKYDESDKVIQEAMKKRREILGKMAELDRP